jgi:hypothetical protein
VISCLILLSEVRWGFRGLLVFEGFPLVFRLELVVLMGLLAFLVVVINLRL